MREEEKNPLQRVGKMKRRSIKTGGDTSQAFMMYEPRTPHERAPAPSDLQIIVCAWEDPRGGTEDEANH